jgi:hypothetical protein
MTKRTLACGDFPGSCCSSCHEDASLGYSELMEVERDDGTLFAWVCCQKLEAAYEARDMEHGENAMGGKDVA